MRRAAKWALRIVLGTLALIVVAVAAALILVHTEFGRERIRRVVESKLASTFTGGATIGKLEGSVLGDLVLRDVVINGPDHQPVIQVAALTINLSLTPLLHHVARVDHLTIDGLDVAIAHGPSGQLDVSHLLVPSPPSAWNVELPDVHVHRAHVGIGGDVAPGGQPIDLDGAELAASATILRTGARDARVFAATTWRQRAAPIAITVALHDDAAVLGVPLATIAIGGVAIEAGNVRVQHGDRLAIGGSVAVRAPAAVVAQLVPQVQLPADVTLAIDAAPDGDATRIAVAGLVGSSQVRVFARGDVVAKTATAIVSATGVDVGALSKGAIIGTGGVVAALEAAAAGPDGKPTIAGMASAWGRLDGVPDAHVGLALAVAGDRVRTAIGIAGDGHTHVGIGADLQRAVGALTLVSGSVLAATDDPRAASGGRAPVRGTLRAALTAHGALSPAPDLAIAGTIAGRRISAAGASMASLDLSIDAAHLPQRPTGKLHVALAQLVRGTMQLRSLVVDAANRQDGRIAIAVRSEPLAAPWLVDLDALVTVGQPCPLQPCARIGSSGKLPIVVDLTRHHVRAGTHSEWSGTSGHLEIDATHIALRDFATRRAGGSGSVELAGSFTRAGPGTGDLTVHAAAHAADLALLGPPYFGEVNATADVHRRGGTWGGAVAVAGHALTLARYALKVDADAKLALAGRVVTVDANVASAGVGSVHVAAQVETPSDIRDRAAWRRLPRTAIRAAELRVDKIDLAAIAHLAKLDGDYRGAIDADFKVTPTSVIGGAHARGLHAPALREAGDVDVALTLAPGTTGKDEIAATLAVSVANLGAVNADAQIGIPTQWLDAAAWRAPSTLHAAHVQVAKLAVDPAMLAKLGLESTLRGDVTLQLDVGANASRADLVLDVDRLRGGPLASPVHVHLAAGIEAADAKFALGVATEHGDNLIALGGDVPIGLDQLRSRPEIRKIPLDATITLPSADAAKLMATLGRNELSGGTLDGKVKLGGTIGAPTVDAQLALAGIRVPPGFSGARVPNLEKLAVAASWDGRAGKVTLTGTEDGGGTLEIVGAGSPSAPAGAIITVDATKFALAPITAFVPGPFGGASGTLDAKVAMHGIDPGTAQITGRLHLVDARVPIAPTVGTLRKGTIDLQIADRKIEITADGKIGAGTVKMTGNATLDGGAAGKAQITLRKVSPIGETQPVIDADVAASIGRADGQWKVDLHVSNGDVRIPDNKGTKLHAVGAPTDMVFASEDTRVPQKDKATTSKVAKKIVVTHPLLVARIDLGSTKIETTEFRGYAHGKLAATVGLHQVEVEGTVAVDSGDVDLFNHRYQVDHANVNFDGSPDPVLDIRLTHDYAEVTTTTDIRGRLSAPTLQLSSDPGNYTEGQLLGFLLGGEPGGDPSNQTRDVATAAGSSLLSKRVGAFVNKALPFNLDVIRYEAATATTSATVTLGSWLTHELFVAARQHIEAGPAENSTEGLLEYYLAKRVILDATAGDRGYDGLDLLWRHRW